MRQTTITSFLILISLKMGILTSKWPISTSKLLYPYFLNKTQVWTLKILSPLLLEAMFQNSMRKSITWGLYPIKSHFQIFHIKVTCLLSQHWSISLLTISLILEFGQTSPPLTIKSREIQVFFIHLTLFTPKWLLFQNWFCTLTTFLTCLSFPILST